MTRTIYTQSLVLVVVDSNKEHGILQIKKMTCLCPKTFKIKIAFNIGRNDGKQKEIQEDISENSQT